MKCCWCQTVKPETDFAWKKVGVKRQNYCRDCRKVYFKKYYKANKKYYANRRDAHKKVIKDFIRALKTNKSCVDCMVPYAYYVLDFDHKHGKSLNVSEAYRQGMTIKRIEQEIEKCDLVCSNCHRERTHRRRQSE